MGWILRILSTIADSLQEVNHFDMHFDMNNGPACGTETDRSRTASPGSPLQPRFPPAFISIASVS